VATGSVGRHGPGAAGLLPRARPPDRAPCAPLRHGRGGHALPGRPVPGPVGERPQALCPAADPGLRRRVHPGPHPDPRDRGVRSGAGADDRPRLRLRALPAGRVPSAVQAVAGPRTRRQPPRVGPQGRRGRPRRGPEPLRRRHRPLPPAGGLPAGLRAPPPAGRARRSAARGRRGLADLRAAHGQPRQPLPGRPGLDPGALLAGRLRRRLRHPGPALPRGGREPAVHHGQGPRAPGLRAPALRERGGQVLAGGALHRALLRTGRGRRRSPGIQPGLGGHDHRQLIHEARVRQEADRGIPAPGGPDPRDRHLGGLHPRPRHADGDPLRAQPAAGREHRAGRAGRTWRARDPGRPGPGEGVALGAGPIGSPRGGERVRDGGRHCERDLQQAPVEPGGRGSGGVAGGGCRGGGPIIG